MKRRNFLLAAAAAPTLAQVPQWAIAQQLPFNPKPANWRTFELVTRVEIAKPAGESKIWVPLPSVDSDYQKTVTDSWTGNTSSARIVSDGKYGAMMLLAEFSPNERMPWVEVTSRFQTRDRSLDFARRSGETLSPQERAFYTEATSLMPVDGIVRKTALEATKGAKTEMEKARALYEWIVDNTFRDPKTVGCGRGDVKVMLETRNLSGKCADLNALYVAMARSVGLPARDVYGIRVAKSQFGYRSLGAGTENVTRAQHCRAEVFVNGSGWIPVDPADVRKVVLEEPPGNLAVSDAKVAAARKALFGSWETNWLAYNCAHDVALPGSKVGKVGFLMYPEAETNGARLDALDPENFRYTIRTKETTSA